MTRFRDHIGNKSGVSLVALTPCSVYQSILYIDEQSGCRLRHEFSDIRNPNYYRNSYKQNNMPETIQQNGVVGDRDHSITRDPPTTRPGNLFSDQISAEYHNDPSNGYYIPTTTMRQPKNRRLKVITIGAGFAGIMLAHNIERDCENIEHKVYEKNSNVGGTWVT